MNLADYDAIDTPAAQARAWAMLTGLQAAQSHVFVRCANAQGLSLLIEADPERQIVLFDALRGVPPPGRVGAPMRFEAQIDGRRLEFGCYFQSLLNLPDGPAWLASQPRLLRDMERRTCFRLRIPTRTPLTALIADADGGQMSGRLLDLSRAGFAATLPLALEAEVGTTTRCSLALPGLSVECEASLRHLRSGSDGTRVGFQFMDLPRPLNSTLARTVVKLERELLRKYPKPVSRRRR